MKRSASIRTIGISSVALVLTLAFSLIFFMPKAHAQGFSVHSAVASLHSFFMPKAHAQGKYFNSYYIGFNLGVIKTSFSGLPSISGGTYNLSFGKNININNIVIGGDVALGYSDNGSYIFNNLLLTGDNLTVKTSSTYFAAALKAGYVFKKIMPFVKLGYIGIDEKYSASLTYSVAGPYRYLTSSSKTGNGILYGAGVEYMFNRTWGIIAQYSGTSMSIDSSNVKTNAYTLGVNYNF